MNRAKKRRLQKAGFVETTVKDFLGLSDAEAMLVEMQVALARKLRQARKRRSLTQTQVAIRIGTTQARVAKMEAGKESTLDRMVLSLLALGVSPREIGKELAR